MKKVLLSILLMSAFSLSALANHCQQPVSAHLFDQLIHNLRPTRSQVYRLNQLTSLVQQYCFDSYQMKILAFQLRDDENKIKLGIMAYDRVTDPNNFYDYYDAFNQFSMAFRLHDLIHCQIPPPPVIIEEPVEIIVCEPTSAQFSQINASIKNQHFSREKLDLVRLITKDYCFTVGQIKVLMNNFNFSSDKLEMAKLAYNVCLDQHNYYQLIDLLTFSSEKNELRNYIQSARS